MLTDLKSLQGYEHSNKHKHASVVGAIEEIILWAHVTMGEGSDRAVAAGLGLLSNTTT